MRWASPILFSLLAASAAQSAQQPEPRTDSQSAVTNAPNSQAFNAHGNLTVNNYARALDVTGSKVAITAAYLLPAYDFIAASHQIDGKDFENGFRDAAMLCVEVTNISSQPLLVTAMRLDVLNPQDLRAGPVGFGHCPGDKVSSVGPECLLQPAQRKKWLVHKGIAIPGLVEFLKQQDGEEITDIMRPRFTNHNGVIDRFNSFLRTVVSDKTMLKVSIFERDYQPVLIGHFQLADGKSMFSTEPSLKRRGKKDIRVFPLQHDFFLGEALSQIKAGKTDSPILACSSQ